jgi:hypothetical protein
MADKTIVIGRGAKKKTNKKKTKVLRQCKLLKQREDVKDEAEEDEQKTLKSNQNKRTIGEDGRRSRSPIWRQYCESANKGKEGRLVSCWLRPSSTGSWWRGKSQANTSKVSCSCRLLSNPSVSLSFGLSLSLPLCITKATRPERKGWQTNYAKGQTQFGGDWKSRTKSNRVRKQPKTRVKVDYESGAKFGAFDELEIKLSWTVFSTKLSIRTSQKSGDWRSTKGSNWSEMSWRVKKDSDSGIRTSVERRFEQKGQTDSKEERRGRNRWNKSRWGEEGGRKETSEEKRRKMQWQRSVKWANERIVSWMKNNCRPEQGGRWRWWWWWWWWWWGRLVEGRKEDKRWVRQRMRIRARNGKQFQLNFRHFGNAKEPLILRQTFERESRRKENGRQKWKSKQKKRRTKVKSSERHGDKWCEKRQLLVQLGRVRTVKEVERVWNGPDCPGTSEHVLMRTRMKESGKGEDRGHLDNELNWLKSARSHFWAGIKTIRFWCLQNKSIGTKWQDHQSKRVLMMMLISWTSRTQKWGD